MKAFQHSTKFRLLKPSPLGFVTFLNVFVLEKYFQTFQEPLGQKSSNVHESFLT
jgi:hypothetical protein